MFLASYHTSLGHDSDDVCVLTSQGMDTLPLHALWEGAPALTVFMSTGRVAGSQQRVEEFHYWVDLTFQHRRIVSIVRALFLTCAMAATYRFATHVSPLVKETTCYVSL